MEPRTAAPVVIRADAAADVGVGHAMRMLALSEELISRGVGVVLAGEVSIDWVAKLYAEAGVILVPAPASPPELVDVCTRLRAQACVLDRYTLGPDYGAALRHSGVRTMAVVDAEFGADQIADIYLDQNPGASPHPVHEGQIALAGAPYTLFRDAVRSQRRDASALTPGPLPSGAGDSTAAQSVRVLAVFGGTDPFGAGDVLAPLIFDTGLPVELTLVRPLGKAPVDFTPSAPGQRLIQTGPLADLPQAALKADVVITAAGSSVWELMCLGVAVGIVCVVDNQLPGYRATLAQGIASGLGLLDDLRLEGGGSDNTGRDDTGRSDNNARSDARRSAMTVISDLVTNDPGRRERAIRAQRLLDGRGRERVADVLLG